MGEEEAELELQRRDAKEKGKKLKALLQEWKKVSLDRISLDIFTWEITSARKGSPRKFSPIKKLQLL